MQFWWLGVVPSWEWDAKHVLPRYAGFFRLTATFKADPIGDFTLNTQDFALITEELDQPSRPTVILHEGGYATAWLGKNVGTFLQAYLEASKK